MSADMRIGERPDVSGAETLVGRRRVVEAVLAHIRQGRSTVLLGAAGVGKTAILQAIAQHLARVGGPRRPLYCSQARTLKVALQSIALTLLAQGAMGEPARPSGASLASFRWPVTRRAVGAWSLPKLRRQVVRWLSDSPHVVLLDHIGIVRGSFADMIEELSEDSATPVVIAARSVASEDTGRLWWATWNFQRVAVPALSAGEARQFIEDMLGRTGVSLPDRAGFIKQAVRLTHGNPGLLVRLCTMAQTSICHGGGRTNVPLLLLDAEMHDLQRRLDVEARIAPRIHKTWRPWMSGLRP